MSRRRLEVTLMKEDFDDIDTRLGGNIDKEVEREIKIKRRVNKNKKPKGKDKRKFQFSR